MEADRPISALERTPEGVGTERNSIFGNVD